MLFSVIVPIYNVQEYLSECVHSVRNQTFSDWELLLVDDGSPDQCPELCDQYEKEDARIHALHKQNGGLSSARNYGMQHAQGDWIVFLDGDDSLNNDALFSFSAIMSKEADMLQGRIVYISPDEKECVSNFSGPLIDSDARTQYAYFLERARGTPCWAAWQWCYRRSMIEENKLRFQVGLLCEDAQWLPEVLLHARKIAFTDYPFYRYRTDRIGSIMTQHSTKCILDFTGTAKRWSEYLETYAENSAFRTALYEQLLRRSVVELSEAKNAHEKERSLIFKNLEQCADKKIPMRRLSSKATRWFIRLMGPRVTYHLLTALKA